MTKARIINNEAGGIDLVTERDSGNEVRILTGAGSYSLDFWTRLLNLAKEAQEILATSSRGGHPYE